MPEINNNDGFSFESFKIKNLKPFSIEDLHDTWFLSLPDGNGNVIHTRGRWINGQMVQEGKETVKDPLAHLLE